MRITISGVLVSATERPYDFKDDQTGDRVAGTARRLYVVPDGEAPVEVKVHENDLDKFFAAQQLAGQYVEVECEVPARSIRLAEVRAWSDESDAAS